VGLTHAPDALRYSLILENRVSAEY